MSVAVLLVTEFRALIREVTAGDSAAVVLSYSRKVKKEGVVRAHAWPACPLPSPAPVPPHQHRSVDPPPVWLVRVRAWEWLCACSPPQALGQTGDGHFSPVGGYHPDKDLVLLMDVVSCGGLL